MSELIGFPFLNQLNIWDTTDGRPSENDLYNCVPTSIAAGIQYLTGKHLSPDAMKDEAYGENWVDMGTAASAFVGIADRNGVKLYSRAGDCVAIAHEELAKGHPVVFTQQDDYSTNPDFTHVSVWYKDGSGWLSAMDPFGGKEVRYDDATWRARMRANDVWIMEKEMGVPANWKDDGTTLRAPNGVPVVQGFRSYVLNHPWDPNNFPLEPEAGANPIEMSNPTLGGGTRQRFRKTTLEWTSKMGVFEAWTGQELIALSQKVSDMQKQVDSLNQQLASTQNANVEQLQAQLEAANAQLGTIKTALATIQSEIGKVLA